MGIKGIGAILIVIGCGGFGFSLASGIKIQEKALNQLICALQIMESDLEYRLTPLPELFRLTAKVCGGDLKSLFVELYKRLSCQDQTDASVCMDEVLAEFPDIPRRVRRHLMQLGNSVGRFDLMGQLQGIRSIRSACNTDLAILQRKKDDTIRSYRTLSLCAGTALAILLV